LAANAIEDLLKIVLSLDLHLDRPALLFLALHHAEAPHPMRRSKLDPPDVLLARPHLPSDDDEWQGHGELRRPVATAGVDEAIDEPVGDIAHEWVQGLDPTRPKGVVEHAPHLAVTGVVPAGERRSRDPTFLLVEVAHALRSFQHLGGSCDPALALVSVGVGVGEQGADVVVACHQEHAGARIPPGRRIIAEDLVGAVRALVGGLVEEIDFSGEPAAVVTLASPCDSKI
jgi:hypothetical protein